MEFVQNFTPPDFQDKNFTPSISPNFNSFSRKKNTKNEWKWRNLHRWLKLNTVAGSDGMDKSHLWLCPIQQICWVWCGVLLSTTRRTCVVVSTRRTCVVVSTGKSGVKVSTGKSTRNDLSLRSAVADRRSILNKHHLHYSVSQSTETENSHIHSCNLSLNYLF